MTDKTVRYKIGDRIKVLQDNLLVGRPDGRTKGKIYNLTHINVSYLNNFGVLYGVQNKTNKHMLWLVYGEFTNELDSNHPLTTQFMSDEKFKLSQIKNKT